MRKFSRLSFILFFGFGLTYACSIERDSKGIPSPNHSPEKLSSQELSDSSLALDPYKPELFLGEVEALSDQEAKPRSAVSQVEITGRRFNRESQVNISDELEYDIRSKVIIEGRSGEHKILLYPYLRTRTGHNLEINAKLLAMDVGQKVEIAGVDLKIADQIRGFARIVSIELIP